MRRLGAVAVLALLAVAPAAAAQGPQETVVARLAAPTPVSAVPGGVLYSDRDPATGRYRLQVTTVGAIPLVLPFPQQDEPFDADLGSDSRGHAAVIASVGGDLYVQAIDRGPVRPVRNANTRRDEHAPTMDRGRIAFARTYGAGDAARDVVYAKRLIAPRSRPSDRLPGVPTRRCLPGRPSGSSCATGERQVEQLDLVDGQLAQHVRYRVGGAAAHFQDEVRWVVRATRQARQVAHVAGGESVQRFEGVQFAGSRLTWYRGCERSCPDEYTAAFRYRPGVGYDVDPAPPGGLSGFAADGLGTWQVRGAVLSTCGGEEPGVAPCELVRTPEPRWRRIAASRVRLSG